ncbi:hypothetical protein D3C86_1419660 [compost metagenome]
MRTCFLILALTVGLAACSTPGQPDTSASPSADPSNTLNGATIEVTRDGNPLKVEPKLADNDYGYQRDFVFGKYTVNELEPMGDDEVGVVYTDGNLYNNSSAIKLRLNFNKGRIFEVSGGPDTPNTEQHPGIATKHVSNDKSTLVLYTYKGKMLDTGNGRKPTAEEFSVTIRNLTVKRK